MNPHEKMAWDIANAFVDKLDKLTEKDRLSEYPDVIMELILSAYKAGRCGVGLAIVKKELL